MIGSYTIGPSLQSVVEPVQCLLCKSLLQRLNLCNACSFEEAELMARRSLVIRERSFGSDDPLTACSLNSLALLLKDANQLNEAETMCRKCIDIRCGI